MKDELVTFETAKGLREIGFNEFCASVIINKEGNIMNTIFRHNDELPKNAYSLPSQSIAQRWFREKANMHIDIYNNACGYGYVISKADNGTHIVNDLCNGPNNGGVWDNYEGALEAALQESIKIIKK